MRSRLKARFVILAMLSVLLTGTAVLTTAGPAAAASGTVKIEYGDWNCPSGGSVQMVLLASIDRGGEVALVPGRRATTW
jgi:hypothetical protein